MTTEPTDRPLVTVLGATGFVGSAVLAALAGRDLRLRAVARRPAVGPAGARAEVEVVTADLTDRAALAAAVKDADVVIHTLLCEGGWRAAAEPDGERVNVGVMRDLLDVAANPDRPPLVIYAGAASQVGAPPREPLDGTEPDRPGTVYDEQKLTAERLLLAASEAGLVRGVGLRLPTVFGEGTVPGTADRGVVAAMARRALDGQEITLWHDGTVRRDLVHIADIAAAFVAAVDHPAELAGRAWLLGAGRGDALGDVFRTVARLAAARTGGTAVPVVSVQPPAHAPRTDFLSVTIDSTPFRTATGWLPRVPLDEGLSRTVTALSHHR
ncbi:NAD-dependent epimerase/dehydratase family protein [Paractinoplanes lichenicola]|uniref:NAD-dependent epimerase/dehydratase family protein n=1 Tax=Paractinoplanes lichenicola TaxID=2802976 RepID=A0ABS1VFE5_9ACTN|nr:NAD-dependent epimerase/dehydratase family protein [Actinoplanes lichenicola]MBL7253420.1 NAD-dependent epimerase/dehydratase family protein [Actinoplanes lichenicola]